MDRQTNLGALATDSVATAGFGKGFPKNGLFRKHEENSRCHGKALRLVSSLMKNHLHVITYCWFTSFVDSVDCAYIFVYCYI